MIRKIAVNEIRCYAFHGCLKEESIIGTWFSTNVEVDFDFSSSAKSDELSETLDYCLISKIVQDEMAVRAKLIEQVLERIFNKIQGIPGVLNLKVELTKEKPPIEGNVASVTVSMEG